MTIAAIISKGYEWPVDKTPSPIGDVILLSAEDDPADTIRPRLDAAGANPQRVHILKAVQEVNAEGVLTQRMFSLKRDLAALEEILSSLPDCKLVTVDPISAYLDDINSHRNAAVRGLIAPLAALAAKHKIAVIAVDHLNKNSHEGNALYRPGGSLAFVAAARAVYIVTKDKEKPERCLVMPIKNNIARANAGLAYSVVGTENNAPVMVWEPEPVNIKIDEVLAQLESEERSEIDWAILFLEDLLANGRKLASEVHKEANDAHIKNKALRRAQSKLGIQPFKDKTIFNGPWWWVLPGHEVAQSGEGVLLKIEGMLDSEGHLRTTDNAKLAEDSLNLGMDSKPKDSENSVDGDIKAEDIPF